MGFHSAAQAGRPVTESSAMEEADVGLVEESGGEVYRGERVAGEASDFIYRRFERERVDGRDGDLVPRARPQNEWRVRDAKAIEAGPESVAATAGRGSSDFFGDHGRNGSRHRA